MSSLYTIIGHDEALRSTEWALEYFNVSRTHKKYLLKCLSFCLDHNYFWYKDLYLLQVKGVPMGARFVPSVAIFLWHFGNRIKSYQSALSNWSYTKRFINDLIGIWKGDMSSLKLFMHKMDRNNKNIKLTWTISFDSITFLDLEIFKEGDQLYTKKNSNRLTVTLIYYYIAVITSTSY